MSRERWANGAVALALLVVGGFAWWLQLRPALEPRAASLATLPIEIAGWRAVDLPIESAVESVLQADFNLQRAYRHSTHETVWLYIGYYGTERGGRPEHTPRGCYTGAGWTIASQRTLSVDEELGLRVNEYLVEKQAHRRLVHFWYRSHRRTGILGGLDQNMDRLLGRIFVGRADGALIRISTPLSSGDLTGARSRLLAFAAMLDPLVADRWPEERPASEESP